MGTLFFSLSVPHNAPFQKHLTVLQFEMCKSIRVATLSAHYLTPTKRAMATGGSTQDRLGPVASEETAEALAGQTLSNRFVLAH